MTDPQLPRAAAVRTLAAPYGQAAAVEVMCPRCGQLHRHRYRPGDNLVRAASCGRGHYRLDWSAGRG